MSEVRGELWARGYMLGATSQVHWRAGDRQLAEVQARAGAATKHVIDDRSGLSKTQRNQGTTYTAICTHFGGRRNRRGYGG